MNNDKSLGEWDIHSRSVEGQESRRDFHRIKVIEKKFNIDKGMLSIGLNASYYRINSVRKYAWEDDAPWYREAQDGLNWIAYCKNLGCEVYKQMVIWSRGFGTFNFSEEAKTVGWPVWKSK